MFYYKPCVGWWVNCWMSKLHDGKYIFISGALGQFFCSSYFFTFLPVYGHQWKCVALPGFSHCWKEMRMNEQGPNSIWFLAGFRSRHLDTVRTGWQQMEPWMTLWCVVCPEAEQGPLRWRMGDEPKASWPWPWWERVSRPVRFDVLVTRCHLFRVVTLLKAFNCCPNYRPLFFSMLLETRPNAAGRIVH